MGTYKVSIIYKHKFRTIEENCNINKNKINNYNNNNYYNNNNNNKNKNLLK